MNRIFTFPVMAFVCLFLCAFQMPQQTNLRYTPAQIQHFIQEVFADQANVLAASGSLRREDLERFLMRVRVEAHPEFKGKKIKLLSAVPLYTKYNPALKHDLRFELQMFNPLKYRFPLGRKEKLLYRADGTDFLIIIEPDARP